jgi:DNA-binding MarR family transcriptional regulator
MQPNLQTPASIFDLLNFRVSEFYGVSGSMVTKLCEGEFGVTREEWQFIAMLAHLGPLAPSELAQRTTVDRSQASRTLRALSTKKLIYRQTVPGDRRRALVGLKDSGKKLYAELFPRAAQVHHAVLEALSANEIKVLSRCLEKIHARALVVAQSDLVRVQADRRHGGSRRLWPVM